MTLWLCLAAIFISILIGWKYKLNTGIIAMAFAYMIGYFGLGLSVNDVIKFWPVNIVFYLLSIALLFNYATINGTMDSLGKKLLYWMGGNAKAIPLAIALVCAVIGGLGAGASTPAIIGPFAFAMALSAGVSPVLTAICIAFGNLLGSNNPYNGYGGVISKNLIIESGSSEKLAMTMSRYIWVNCIFMSLLVIAVFYVLMRGYKTRKVSVEKPAPFSTVQKKTTMVLITAFLLMVVPEILSAWMPLPLLKALSGICKPQSVMIFGAVMCAMLHLAPEKEVIERVPINTIVMIVGVYMLIKVAAAAGLVEFISAILTSTIPRWMVPGTLVLFAAFLSFFSSSTSTVMPLMYPMVPQLAAMLGLNPVMLYSCVFFGGLSTSPSPFSTGGALTIASCADEKVRETLPNKMIVCSLVIPLITVAAVQMGMFSLFSLPI